MRLNSASAIALLTWRNSGVSRYLANACSQSPSDNGGHVPTIGCHSVIDSPECVKRVMPPTTTIAKTSAQHISNQPATTRALCLASPALARTRSAKGPDADGAMFTLRIVPSVHVSLRDARVRRFTAKRFHVGLHFARALDAGFRDADPARAQISLAI